MSSIGPQLPVELSKRKRTRYDDDDDSSGPHPLSPPTKQVRTDAPTKNSDEVDLGDSDGDDDDMGAKAPGRDSAPAPRAVGPTLPPSIANNNEIHLDSDSDSDDTGPAPPPPPPQQAQAQPPSAVAAANGDTSSDSEDDGYGPVLPSAPTAKRPTIGPSLPPTEQTPQRDSWMVAPPTSSGYKERDPTRMKNRKFASKSSNPSSSQSGISSMWTETPEEKLKRQRDALLGRSAGPDSANTASSGSGGGTGKSREQEERDRRIAASIEAQRGRSLYDEHGDKRKDGKDEKKVEEEEEDDPSKRAFDREKDMALGGKIGTAQRRELITKSANFGGRFQKGSFL